MRHLAILALLVVSQLAVAQKKFYTGPRIGIGQSQFTDMDSPRELMYFTAGGVATYQVTGLIDINAEALLAYQGSGYQAVQDNQPTLGFNNRQPYSGTTRLFSLKIPLYPGVSIGSDDFRFRIHAGPSLDFNFYAVEDRDYDDPRLRDEENEPLEHLDPLTFAMIYGAGVRIRASEEKWVFLDFRYSTGLSSVHTFYTHVNPSSPRINYFSISAGYLF